MGNKKFILAIDPGTTNSGWIVMSGMVIVDMGITDNDKLVVMIRERFIIVEHLAIEMVACYGMAVGKEVFDTCVWVGRFIEAYKRPYTFIYRRQVKLNLCNSARAKDANVSQALRDRFAYADNVILGGGKTPVVGTKKQPGSLYGVKKHIWSALAVAVTWMDTHESPQLNLPDTA